MAVQAHHLSNNFFPEFHSSAQTGSVFEGFQMLQSFDHQIGHLHTPLTAAFATDVAQLPTGLTNATVLSDHPQSDLTCNASCSRKRSRDEPITPIVRQIFQQLPVFNSGTTPPIRACLVAPPSGFHVSSGPSYPLINDSVAPSTSDRPAGVSTSLLPFVSAVSPELLAQLNHQSNEIDNFLRHQSERLRLGMEEALKRYYKTLLSYLGLHAAKRLREKETELEKASRRNAELEEKAGQMSAERLIWFNLAKNSEAIVSNLRTSLEQAMIQKVASRTAPPTMEGYGESDSPVPFPADDAQSCCFKEERRVETTAVRAPASGEVRYEIVCKVCRRNDVCVLVLPCRHLCLCKDCEAGVDTCPICHSHKKASLQIFMS